MRGADERQHARAAEHRGRQVDGRQPAREVHRVALVVRALGEHQGEVQEQRRQQEQGDHVGPVEGPVHAIEAPAEREREDPEERHAQPEEVEGGLVVGPTGPDGRADEQREDADARQQVVEEAGAIGEWRQLHLRHFARPQSEQGVDVIVAGLRAVLNGEHLVAAFDRLAVNRQEHIARAHAGAAGRRGLGHLGRNDARGAFDPEHAVLDLGARRPRDDVGNAQSQQAHRDHNGQGGATPVLSLRGAEGGQRLVREPVLGTQDRYFQAFREQTVYQSTRAHYARKSLIKGCFLATRLPGRLTYSSCRLTDPKTRTSGSR